MHTPFAILPAKTKQTPSLPTFHHGIPPSTHQESKRNNMAALSYDTNYSYMRMYQNLGYFFSFLDDNMDFPGSDLLDRRSLGSRSSEYRHPTAHAIVVIRSRGRVNAHIYRV